MQDLEWIKKEKQNTIFKDWDLKDLISLLKNVNKIREFELILEREKRPPYYIGWVELGPKYPNDRNDYIYKKGYLKISDDYNITDDVVWSDILWLEDFQFKNML